MQISYIVIPIVTIAVAATGSWFTSIGIESGWYSQLVVPPWNPPSWIFGPVWTVIYVLTALAAVIAIATVREQVGRYWLIALFILNAVANGAWSYLFFVRHELELATIDAGVITLSVLIVIGLLLRAGVREHQRVLWYAAAMLAPYAAWAGFATYLTYRIALLN